MKRNERGFTLMELMVVIVIVAILAAVAVPLYVNYVKDAQRTEAKGAIGAIISAEQVYMQRNGVYVQATPANYQTTLNVDLTDSQAHCTFTIGAHGANTNGFTVKATNKADANMWVLYTHDRGTPANAGFTDDSSPAGGGGTGT